MAPYWIHCTSICEYLNPVNFVRVYVNYCYHLYSIKIGIKTAGRGNSHKSCPEGVCDGLGNTQKGCPRPPKTSPYRLREFLNTTQSCSKIEMYSLPREKYTDLLYRSCSVYCGIRALSLFFGLTWGEMNTIS